MNILELCLSPGLGGLELYVYRSTLFLSQENTVIPVLNPNGKLESYFKNNSETQTIGLECKFKPLPIKTARILARLIDNKKIDIIHIHWGKDLPLAALAKVFAKRNPGIIYTRQMQITRSKNDFYHNFLYKQVDLILTITNQLEACTKKFIPFKTNQIKTLYYGVKRPENTIGEDEKTIKKEKLGLNSNDFLIGLFGRLEDGKGQHLLLKAIKQAADQGNTFKALIVGHEMTQGYRETLKELAESLGISKNIIIKGFVTDPQSLMQICDCLVLASYSETFGLVLPEAMRCGIPVIGSNAGGVPEIIDHDSTGLLFKPRSSSDLYEQLYKLYSNPELKSSIAQQGKDKADSLFNYDHHFQQLLRYMHDLTDLK